MLLTLAPLRREAFVASIAKTRAPVCLFVAPHHLPHPRGLNGAPMRLRALGLRAPAAAGHLLSTRAVTAGRRAAPCSLSVLRMDSEAEQQVLSSHFFFSLTPNRAPESSIGSTRLRLDRSITFLEHHLAEEQLQQDWVDADPATAFFLALTLQMEFQGILASSPANTVKGGLDLKEQADGLAQKVVEHLAAHPELRVSPVTAQASAVAAAATAGSSSWRRAVEDESGGSMVGEGIMSAAAHLLQVDLIKLSVTVEGLVETIFPPPQGVASRGTLVVVCVGAVVWSTSPLGSGNVRSQARLTRKGDAAAAAAAAAAAVVVGEQKDAARSNVVAAGGASGWFSQEAITDEVSTVSGARAEGHTDTKSMLIKQYTLGCEYVIEHPCAHVNLHTHEHTHSSRNV